MTVAVPFFSIITPVYNSRQFLGDTIRSIEEQSYRGFEHILVDDGSTDGSLQMIEAYLTRDPRARLIRMEKNGGVAAARNEGINQARGTYICFLDSDDWWDSEKLSAQKRLIDESGARFVYGSYFHCREDGGVIKTYDTPPETDFQRMLRGSVIGCLTVAVHRELFQGKRFQKIFHEDYLLWLEILRDHKLTARGLRKPLAYYRLRPKSLSSDKKQAAKAQWRIYREHLGLSFSESIPLFLNYALAGIMKHKVTT